MRAPACIVPTYRRPSELREEEDVSIQGEEIRYMETRPEKIELRSGMSLNWSDFTKGTFVDQNGIFLTGIGT